MTLTVAILILIAYAVLAVGLVAGGYLVSKAHIVVETGGRQADEADDDDEADTDLDD